MNMILKQYLKEAHISLKIGKVQIYLVITINNTDNADLKLYGIKYI